MTPYSYEILNITNAEKAFWSNFLINYPNTNPISTAIPKTFRPTLLLAARLYP
jgi:hypothetical protein